MNKPARELHDRYVLREDMDKEVKLLEKEIKNHQEKAALEYSKMELAREILGQLKRTHRLVWFQ
jgi:hypothetical protein